MRIDAQSFYIDRQSQRIFHDKVCVASGDIESIVTVKLQQHRLLGRRLVSEIETDLRIEVPVAAIFEGNSIRELSRHLLAGVAAAEESVDQMIRRLESLPDTEVEAMLRMERGQSDA